MTSRLGGYHGDSVSDFNMVWSRLRIKCILHVILDCNTKKLHVSTTVFIITQGNMRAVILDLVVSSLGPFNARKYELS